MTYKNFEFNHAAAVITHTRKTYHRTGSGWSSKADAITADPVSVDYYNKFVQASDFFGSRVKWALTDCGRLPVELVTISPDGNIKHVDIFNISIGGTQYENKL